MRNAHNPQGTVKWSCNGHFCLKKNDIVFHVVDWFQMSTMVYTYIPNEYHGVYIYTYIPCCTLLSHNSFLNLEPIHHIRYNVIFFQTKISCCMYILWMIYPKIISWWNNTEFQNVIPQINDYPMLRAMYLLWTKRLMSLKAILSKKNNRSTESQSFHIFKLLSYCICPDFSVTMLVQILLWSSLATQRKNENSRIIWNVYRWLPHWRYCCLALNHRYIHHWWRQWWECPHCQYVILTHWCIESSFNVVPPFSGDGCRNCEPSFSANNFR